MMKGINFVLVAVVLSVVCGERIVLNCRKDLKSQIEDAENGSEILAPSGGCEFVLHKHVNVTRDDITIRGLRARVRDGYPEPILNVTGDRFVMTDFELTGNADSILDGLRETLVYLHGNDFDIRRGKVSLASRDAIGIQPVWFSPNKRIDRGRVSDIVGYRNSRETVSLGNFPLLDFDTGDYGTEEERKTVYVSNVHLENIRAYGSELKGALEVSDGVEDIVVKNIYAEDCRYGIAIQDHGVSEYESNNRVSVSNLIVFDSDFAVLSQTNPIPHSDISFKRVLATDCTRGLRMRHIARLRMDDVRVLESGGYFLVQRGRSLNEFEDCPSLRIRDLLISGGGAQAVAIQQSSGVSLTGISLAEEPKVSKFDVGVQFMEEKGKSAKNELEIKQSFLDPAREDDIKIVPATPVPEPTEEATEPPETPLPEVEPPAFTEAPKPDRGGDPMVFLRCSRDLEQQLAEAEPYATLIGPSYCTFKVRRTIKLRQPQILTGLKVQLVGDTSTPIFSIESEDVKIFQFSLKGNGRGAPLMVIISGGNFFIEDGSFSSTDGDAVALEPRNDATSLEGGHFRRLRGNRIGGYLLSLRAGSKPKAFAKNFFIEDLSLTKGGGVLKMNDGVENVFAHDLSARDCKTAVLIKHNGSKSLVSSAFVTSLSAKNCNRGVQATNGSDRKMHLSMADISLINCVRGIRLTNVKGPRIYGVRIKNSRRDPITLTSCDFAVLRVVDIDGTSPLVIDSAIYIYRSKKVIVATPTIGAETQFNYGLTFDEGNKTPRWARFLMIINEDFAAAKKSPIRIVGG
ncbi:hypothetical protein NDN08_004250 [Rhodosorus marinus]|uniref:Right handed beta helix domain-containing protein n=1 Tax=Rhodosorus marinus TaxID=101924 RepID=A0AAV8UKX4_9RHOD|nr:hypothetical protein NDN08_004250 [Rhodosorus marinus]